MDRTSPRTPFSTPLSGSARQAEARIRNLFQGPKRRPPVWLMVLALLLILSCGGLVVCQDQKVPPEKAEISALSASATSQPLSSEDLLLVDALYGAAAPQMGTAEDGESIPQLLCAHSQDGTTLAAALFQKGSASWLVIGAVEQATSTLRGPAYVVSGPEGAAHIFPFREYGSGQLRLLYTFNTLDQGSRSGSAGVVCLEDSRLTWAWPAEGDILEEGSRAAQEYEEFWQTYLPLLSPSGVELFSRETASSPYGGSPAQWTYHHSDSFWSSPELDLPDGVYEQARVWLEGLAQEGCNPWQTEGLPAAWQIRALTPADGRYLLSSPAVSEEADYLLTAQADSDPELCLTARLRLRHGTGEVPQAVEWTIGTPQELGLDGEPPRCPLPLSDGRTLTLEFDESPIDGMESTVLIRQVKVWDGPVLLQSITAGSVLEDGLHLYEGLYRLPDADKVPGAPDLRDLNGDGSSDLGLLVNCGFPHNVNYAHFLWNEAMGQLVFSGLFFAPLELEDTGGVVETEHVSNYPDIRRRYTFSRYGVPLLTGVVSRGALPPEESTLPIPEEGVHFTFSSGAGAWSTDLTLFPDGTFSGKFHDRDMDITYLCQFQGAFSMLTPLDSRTWSLTLTDLEVTTGRPEGTEWTEGGIRYVAAAPYGLDGGNEFCLYLPGTPAENISPRCRSWRGGYYGLFEAGAVLSGYGLCDLRWGYGFFSFS